MAKEFECPHCHKIVYLRVATEDIPQELYLAKMTTEDERPKSIIGFLRDMFNR